jgi:hypothetical protein
MFADFGLRECEDWSLDQSTPHLEWQSHVFSHEVLLFFSHALKGGAQSPICVRDLFETEEKCRRNFIHWKVSAIGS